MFSLRSGVAGNRTQFSVDLLYVATTVPLPIGHHPKKVGARGVPLPNGVFSAPSSFSPPNSSRKGRAPFLYLTFKSYTFADSRGAAMNPRPRALFVYTFKPTSVFRAQSPTYACV